MIASLRNQNRLAEGLVSSQLKPRSAVTSLRNKWRISAISRGVPGGIRTPNLLIRSQLLYPVELQTPFRPKNGVVNGTRTRNNQNHNLGLYH